MRDGDNTQSAGKSIATGRASTLPLQPSEPQTTDATMSTADRQRSEMWSRIEGDDRPGEAEEAAVRNRPKISGVIGARKRGVEIKMSWRHDATRIWRDRPALPVRLPDDRCGKGTAVDDDVIDDFDMLSGKPRNGLDQWCKPAGAEPAAVAAPARFLERRGRR